MNGLLVVQLAVILSTSATLLLCFVVRRVCKTLITIQLNELHRLAVKPPIDAFELPKYSDIYKKEI